jgi:hypothetical protein
VKLQKSHYVRCTILILRHLPTASILVSTLLPTGKFPVHVSSTEQVQDGLLPCLPLLSTVLVCDQQCKVGN